jgi:hypothetical protein
MQLYYINSFTTLGNQIKLLLDIGADMSIVKTLELNRYLKMKEQN